MNTRIKFLRKNSGLTQEKFAERIGLKQNSIALIESGKRNISDQAILSICREFGVREEWLRTGNGEMYAPAPTNGLDLLAKEKKLTHGEYILIEKFVGLNPETRNGFWIIFRRCLLLFLQTISLRTLLLLIAGNPQKVSMLNWTVSLALKKKKRRTGPKPLDLEAAAQKENMERLRVSPVKPKKKKGRAVCVGSSPFL